MRTFSVLATAGLASAATFKVQYTSSLAKETSSAVKMQLASPTGTSPFIQIDQAISQGVTNTKFLNVNELKNLPNSLKLRATDWNGLNVVSVTDSATKEVAQFSTDYFTSSGAPHSASGTYFYDMVYSSASGADLLASPRAYKISWQTGWHANSGSKSPQYVQLQGSKGKSRYYLVDDVFAPGHAGESTLGVLEDIGALQSVELFAGGADSWNPVNFFEVLTPSGETVQFKAGYMIDQLPMDTANPIAYGVYPHVNKVQLSAINPEGTASATRTYQISYETGTHSNSASSSPMFAQLIGDDGKRSNFLPLGDDFKRGKRNIVDVPVAHSFGLLKSIELLAGGTDGWNVVGDLSVRTPAQVEVHFQTDFYLDEAPHDAAAMYGHYHYHQSKVITAAHPEPPKPCTTRGQLNCCGNGVCDATEDVGNCGRDCIHSGAESYAWGMQETKAPTTFTVDSAIPEHKAGDKHTGAVNGVAGERAKGEWATTTAAPTEVGYTHDGVQTTQHVTSKGKSCTVGAKTVKDGWTMEGTNENYCNYCKCNDGEISCTKRPCGLPFGGDIPTGWSKCAKVGCAFAPEEAKYPYETLRVTSHHLEQGDHSCAYNKFTKKCSCYCKTKKINYTAREVGKHAFATGGFVGKHCEAVRFGGHETPQQFDPAKGKVTTIVTVSHTHRTKPVHDAPMVWVEESTVDGFTVCAREDKKFWNTYDRHDHRLVVDYYAFQEGPNMPFAGARSAATAVASRTSGGVHCKTIPFCSSSDDQCRSFDRAPIVVGSIDHQKFDSDKHQATAHWIEDINGAQFRVCFRESAHHDDGHEQFYFNWMAVQHRNPFTYYKNHAAYSTAGNVPSNGLWAQPTDFHRADTENVGLLACKWIKFEGVTFGATPTVLLTARHAATNAIDWDAEPIHPATLTYVNKASALGFEACATTMHVEGVSSKDDDLVWSYIAFGAHVADTKVVTVMADKIPAPTRTLSTYNGSPKGERGVDGAIPMPTSVEDRFNEIFERSDPKHTGADHGMTQDRNDPRAWAV